MDYNRSPSATNSAAIDSVFKVSEILDPDGNPGHFPYYWTSTTHQDGPNPASQAVYIAFGKALGKMNGTLMDVHGAGAQRSDPKSGSESDYPKYHGPQGDVQMVYNHCRCVREIEIQTSSLGNENEKNPIFYPNPVTKKLTIEWNVKDTNNFKVSIFKMDGSLLYCNLFFKSSIKIDMSAYKEGVYYVLVELKNISLKHKVIKI